MKNRGQQKCLDKALVAFSVLCSLFYATSNQIYRSLHTDDMVFAGTQIWYHTEKHTEYKDTNRLTHKYINIYKYILKPHVTCTHRSYLYCTEWVTCWNKNLWSAVYLLFKNFTCRIHASANKIQKGCVISVNHYPFMKTFWKLSLPLFNGRGPTMKKVIGSIANSEHFI